MIKITNTEISGWEAAIRGARNPYMSHDKSDTKFRPGAPDIGNADYDLLMSLANAGPEHGKFLRMIHVQCDIVAPLYWWKQMDTYKVGTVANSSSTMHLLGKRELMDEDFSTEHVSVIGWRTFHKLLDSINELIDTYQSIKIDGDPDAGYYWMSAVSLLPSCFNQLRTWDASYAVLRTIYHQRKSHKLQEWRDFCTWIKCLSYSEFITGEE